MTDTEFAGSIPDFSDRYLGALLFEPYADEVARRARAFSPRHILEAAAGTGIVTAALHQALPVARIVATDLNAAMIRIAAERVRSGGVTFEVADAQALPFADESFDLVVCQFGAMFYSDKVKANSEVYRVLRPGGHYIAVIWASIERNPATKIAMDAIAKLFPEDPPSFFQRTPHGYADPELIERDLLDGGFTVIELETLEAMSRPMTAREAAIGLCQGTPLRNELEARKIFSLETVTMTASAALAQLELDGILKSRLSAHLVTATK
jgi:ubiquinone/menaquinone biosynthesis C-methylase UbiE